MSSEKEAPDEFRIISEYFRPLSGKHSLKLTDDIALLDKSEVICSKDILIENVHFFSDDSPELIARKALRTNVSDIVAKGAKPVSYLLGCAYSPRTGLAWIERFTTGLQQDQELYGVYLLGGDTTRHKSPAPLVMSVTIFGEPLSGNGPVLRSGAKTGDVLFVSGTIGDAALGLQARKSALELSPQDREYLIGRYLLPEPKVDLAESVARYASASLDVSDGLLADAGHLCSSSELSIEILAEKLPLSDAANAWLAGQRKRDAGHGWLSSAGDDYEILCTVPAERADEFAQSAAVASVRVTEIGRCIPADGKPQVTLVNRLGEAIPVSNSGFSHFG